MIHGSYRSKFRRKRKIKREKLRGWIAFGHGKRAQMSRSCEIWLNDEPMTILRLRKVPDPLSQKASQIPAMKSLKRKLFESTKWGISKQKGCIAQFVMATLVTRTKKQKIYILHLVYKLPCQDCLTVYIDETSRSVADRMNQSLNIKQANWFTNSHLCKDCPSTRAVYYRSVVVKW